MPELLGLTTSATVIGEGKHRFIHVGIIGNEHAALACGGRLGAVKGEAAELAHAAGPLAVIL